MPINDLLLWGTGLQSLNVLFFTLSISVFLCCVLLTFLESRLVSAVAPCAQQLEAFFEGSHENNREQFGLAYCPQTEKQEAIPRKMALKLPILCSDGKVAS